MIGFLALSGNANLLRRQSRRMKVLEGKAFS
jgi:hypothetical protein